MENKRLESEIEEYAKLAKEDNNIDVASLMINAMKTEQDNLVSSKAKKWSYFISVSAPPFGLLIAIRYYFSDKDDATHVANMCILLTAISLGAFLLLGKMLLSSSGTSIDQINQITPAQIHELTQ